MNKFYKPFALLLLGVSVFISSCQISRFVFYNFADIKDHRIFPSRKFEKSEYPFMYYASSRLNEKHSVKYLKDETQDLDEILEKSKTVAFLVVKSDTILFEKYYKGYTDSSVVPSFSVAKSVTSALIGCAIEDKLIQSVDDPVTNYIPEMKKNGFDKVTIKHLLQMTSGLKFNEGYFNPFGHVAASYYGRHLEKQMLKLKLKREPGKEFEYVSGNTQLLGLVLDRALKGKTISDYFKEKIWEPLGMEYEGSWSIDKKKDGMEKTFCCLNARARDFAKFGRLYLNKGNWNGKQIISEDWVRESTKVETTEGSVGYYQYQWWLPSKYGDFMAIGILGQYIYVNPAKKVVIVRLGKNEGGVNWYALLPRIAASY